MKKRKGISLIVLVITILVMIILAGVVIVGLTDNNPIQKAREASFKGDMANLKTQLGVSVAQKLGKDPAFNKEELNVKGEAVKEYIRDMPKKYEGYISISEGEIVYKGPYDEKYDWAADMGLVYTTLSDKREMIENFKDLFSPAISHGVGVDVGLCTDENEDFVIVGINNWIFPENSVPAGFDKKKYKMFFLKYNKTTKLISRKNYFSNGDLFVSNVFADGSGNYNIIGRTNGTSEGKNAGVEEAILLKKVDNMGNEKFNKVYQYGTKNNMVESSYVDGDKNINLVIKETYTDGTEKYMHFKVDNNFNLVGDRKEVSAKELFMHKTLANNSKIQTTGIKTDLGGNKFKLEYKFNEEGKEKTIYSHEKTLNTGEAYWQNFGYKTKSGTYIIVENIRDSANKNNYWVASISADGKIIKEMNLDSTSNYYYFDVLKNSGIVAMENVTSTETINLSCYDRNLNKKFTDTFSYSVSSFKENFILNGLYDEGDYFYIFAHATSYKPSLDFIIKRYKWVTN